MAEVRRVLRNPADAESGYKLWSNGYIEPFGDALPTGFTTRWNDRAWDLWIYSWATPAGLVLTDDGARHAFGGAPGVGAPLVPNNFPIYRFFSMDPTGTGRGYVMACTGLVTKVGTGTPDLSPAPVDTGQDNVRAWAHDYASGKWFQMLAAGGAHSSMGISGPSWPVSPGRDLYRDLEVVDWTAAFPPFYVTNWAGEVYRGNAAESAYQGPQFAGRGDVVRDVSVISDGTGGDPLIISLTIASGAEKRYVVSTAPTVTVEQPSGTVTGYSRPDGVWAYTDPNGDAQTEAQVAWFTAAQYGVVGFDPASSPATERQTVTDRNLRFAAPTVDLANGTYRMYVRAQDSSGLWSAWAYGEFDVDTTPPAAPALTAVVDGFDVELTVTGDDTLEVEFLSGGAWVPVDGSPLLTDGVLVDWEAPFNVERLYRARAVQAFLNSPWTTTSATVAVTPDPRYMWTLSIPGVHLPIDVPRGLEETLPYPAQVNVPGDAYFHTVARTTIRSPKFALTLRFWDTDDDDNIATVLGAQQTMLLRSPFGHHYYIDLAGDVERNLRDVHWGSYTIPVVVTGRPGDWDADLTVVDGGTL